MGEGKDLRGALHEDHKRRRLLWLPAHHRHCTRHNKDVITSVPQATLKVFTASAFKLIVMCKEHTHGAATIDSRTQSVLALVLLPAG